MDQLVNLGRAVIGSMRSTKEQVAVVSSLQELMDGETEAVTEGINRNYVKGEQPVSPERYLADPYYLGEFAKSLYPVWQRDLIQVLDPKAGYEEWAFVGAQGTGKTTIALVAQSYRLYRISCLRHPQIHFGMDPATTIYFGFFTLNRDKAHDALYKKFVEILESSPYFKERFPARKRRIGGLRTSRFQDELNNADDYIYELLFPKGLRVVAGSRTGHALSVTMLSGVLDEMNWRRKRTVKPEQDVDSALSLYEQVRTRIAGRFIRATEKPGLMCTISSKRATTDFMDVLVARMRQEPNRCFISDYALWDVKPGTSYSGKRFYVFVGGSFGQSRILKEEELKDHDLTAKNILSVPEEHRPEFEMNVNTAIRDLGGMSTVPYVLLFENEGLLRQCIDTTRRSPFKADEIPLGMKSERMLDQWFDVDYATVHDGFRRKPRWHTGIPRFIHIDLSKNRAATGMAMVASPTAYRLRSKTPEGREVYIYIPRVFVDFAIRIVAPEADEVDQDKIRQFILYLRRLGFNITGVSFDQYQSVGTSQLLTKDGFNTSHISVDSSDLPYLSLREAFAQKRINMYDYAPLFQELKALIHDIEISNVDHPETDPAGGPGRKDVADGLCGAFTGLSKALAAVRPTVSVPATISLGHLKPDDKGVEASDRVNEIFAGLDQPRHPSVTDSEADAFITADYEERDPKDSIEEALKTSPKK